MFFYDTGLLCYLLGITSQSVIESHALCGNIFENWIITEIKKNRFNNGINEGLYFLRDSTGKEIDLLLEKEGKTMAIEIKASKKNKFSNDQWIKILAEELSRGSELIDLWWRKRC